MCVEFFTKEGFKKTAEKIRDHERTIIKILALLLGFYASTLMRRWWGQVSKLPRLNDVAMVMNAIFQPGKVLSLLEACFDLISGSSLSMKIQIMGGKITENLGFKSPLWKVNIKNLFFFLFLFKFFT